MALDTKIRKAKEHFYQHKNAQDNWLKLQVEKFGRSLTKEEEQGELVKFSEQWRTNECVPCEDRHLTEEEIKIEEKS